MPTSISRDEAKIVLRLDTAAAERDLSRFTGRLKGATATVGVSTAGAVSRASGSAGGGRGGGGLLGGLGFGRLGGIAIGAEFAAPILGDLHKIAAGTLGGLGHAASVALGLSAAARTAEVPGRAAQRGIELAGLGALGATKEENQAIYGLVHDLEQMRAEAANKFESDTSSKRTEDIVDWLKTHILTIIEILIAIKVASMAGAALKGITRGFI